MATNSLWKGWGMMELYHSCWTTGTTDSTGGWSLETLDDLILRIVCDGFLNTALGKQLTSVSLVSKALILIHLGASMQAHWSYIWNRHSREFGFPKIPFNSFRNSQCSCLLTILPLFDVNSHIRYPSISIHIHPYPKVYCPEFAGVLALRFGFPEFWIQQWCTRIMGRSAFTTDEDAWLGSSHRIPSPLIDWVGSKIHVWTVGPGNFLVVISVIESQYFGVFQD